MHTLRNFFISGKISKTQPTSLNTNNSNTLFSDNILSKIVKMGEKGRLGQKLSNGWQEYLNKWWPSTFDLKHNQCCVSPLIIL
jgi:hypothetical protein